MKKKIKWYTRQEFYSLFFGKAQYFDEENGGPEGWGKELGNGWRLWATIDALAIIPLLFLGIIYPSAATIIAASLLIAPLAMTAGYLFIGAPARNFSIKQVIAAAKKEFFVN